MKKILSAAAFLSLLCLSAGPVKLAVPFTKGTKTPVQGWEGKKAKLITIGKATAVELAPGTDISHNKMLPAKAGDKVVFEIDLKKKNDVVSIRLGQWSPQGWVGEAYAFLTPKGNDGIAKGEVLVTDATAPDKAGVIRKTNRIHVKIYAHNTPQGGAIIRNVKLTIVPQK